MIEQAAQQRPRRIDTAEVAKLIRKHLKAVYPGQKFSVRSSRYSGGSSIHVRWTDGPKAAQVDTVVKPYAGSGFDGMIDLKYGKYTWYCAEHGARIAEVYGHSYNAETSGYGEGNRVVDSRCCAGAELVDMGVDFVFTQRDLSPEFEAELQALVAKQTGEDYDPHKRVWDTWMSQLVYRESVKISKYVRPAGKRK